MLYRIIVQQINGPSDGEPTVEIELYRQTVETLDLAQLAAMVNRKPRKPRAKKGAE